MGVLGAMFGGVAAATTAGDTTLQAVGALFQQAEMFEWQLAVMTQIHQEIMAGAQDVLDTAKQDIRG